MKLLSQKRLYKYCCNATLTLIIGLLSFNLLADPASDKEKFQNFFSKKFPSIEFNEFANGVYAIDPESRAQWKDIEEFPPYVFAIEEGEKLFKTPFITGRTYADCLPDRGIGIAHTYPRFNVRKNQVVTLAQELNTCRQFNREEPLPWGRGDLALILAYLASTSRGKEISITISNAASEDAYNKGKKLYYSRTGQLNISCAHCHVDNAGKRIRADILSPALGQTSHFPVYRARWGEMGTLHRRFAECSELSRAKAFPLQSEEYRNLEYFLSYMGNGIEANGPGARK